ncbi:hypothetical protein F2Q69_00014115 [Brassica cretica]|uniref:HMA domain-containing protein n=1 Tax=Brassica cretica TaxID=69181 RepID=A0A8S9QR76_BRACR|nr:hypothetical protein F2Q69_00014115 [Brassica cretica]
MNFSLTMDDGLPPLSYLVETIRETIEDAGFEASSIENEANERSRQVCRIRINGMTCTSCSSTIESVLQSLNGVQIAHVALAIEEAEDDVSKIDLKIDGEFTDESMTIVERSLEALPGVQSVEIKNGSDKISVLYKPDVTGPRNLIRVIESTVFGQSGHIKATVFSEGGVGRESQKQEEIRQYYKSFLWSLVFTVPVFLTAMVFMYIPGIKHLLMYKVINMLTIGEIIRWLLATPVQFIIGWRFYVGSYKALRRGSANMDVLIALGTNAAYFYSLYTVLRAAKSRFL